MKVTMLLADAAQQVGGKLYVLGGGWNITGPQPTPSAIGLIIEIPWGETNKKHVVSLKLVDSDGHFFKVQTPDGMRDLEIRAEFEIGRPPGIKPGTSSNVPLGINIPPLALIPDTRYEWRLTLNGDTHDDWRLTFQTRAIQLTQGPPMM